MRALASAPAGAISVSALQEVHGSEFVLSAALAHIPKELLAFPSCAPDGQYELHENAGGVATIISAPRVPAPVLRHLCSHIPGRALRVRYRRGEYGWAHWNIHNFDISHQQLRALEAMVRRDMLHIRTLPAKRFGFLCGDFNCLVEGDVSCSFAAPNVPARTSQSQRRPPGAVAALPGCAPRVAPAAATHYVAASNTVARLTRMYSILPNWAHLMPKGAVRKPPCPESVFRSKLTDHAPLTLVIGARPQLPARLRPVPLAVCKDPRFALHFQAACPPAPLLKELPAAEHLKQVKVALRKASINTRNDMVDGSDSSPAGRALLLTTLARVVWHGNAKHARELFRSHALAKEHLIFTGGRPKIRCNAAF